VTDDPVFRTQQSERVIRLFRAHGPGVKIPWFEMVSERTFSKLKKSVERDLKAWGAEWTGDLPEDEAFRWPLLPKRTLGRKP
jgi:hypothetical protein